MSAVSADTERPTLLSLFREAGLKPNVRVRALSFEMGRGLVGYGFGLQPADDEADFRYVL